MQLSPHGAESLVLVLDHLQHCLIVGIFHLLLLAPEEGQQLTATGIAYAHIGPSSLDVTVIHARSHRTNKNEVKFKNIQEHFGAGFCSLKIKKTNLHTKQLCLEIGDRSQPTNSEHCLFLACSDTAAFRQRYLRK